MTTAARTPPSPVSFNQTAASSTPSSTPSPSDGPAPAGVVFSGHEDETTAVAVSGTRVSLPVTRSSGWFVLSWLSKATPVEAPVHSSPSNQKVTDARLDALVFSTASMYSVTSHSYQLLFAVTRVADNLSFFVGPLFHVTVSSVQLVAPEVLHTAKSAESCFVSDTYSLSVASRI